MPSSQSLRRYCRVALVGAMAMLLAGCGWSDLSRLDRSVQASWSVLLGADQLNLELAERLIKGRHVALSADRNFGARLRTAADELRLLNSGTRIDLTDNRSVAAYVSARASLIEALNELAKDLSVRSSPMRAWRSRALYRQFQLGLMRSREAVHDYNSTASLYNRSLGQDQVRFSKALLYPGVRRVALLQADAGQ